jgi:hypothetical protein
MQRRKRQMKPIPALFLLGLGLAGCAPPAEAPPQVAPAQRPSSADMTPGLNQKEPDTCEAVQLQGLVGQTSGMLRTMPAPGPVRVIGPDTVYDQEEYRSDRVNVFIDGAGVIRYLSCG